LGKLAKVEIQSDEALSLARKIVDYKEKNPIKSWSELRAILKDANLPHEKIELILTNLNPNSHLNFFYPPSPLFKSMSKIDMINYTTEITFFPTGVFEFDAKTVLVKKDAKLAVHSVYEIRKIFDLIEIINQDDFAIRMINGNRENSLEIYPLSANFNQVVNFDGYVARSNIRFIPTDNSIFSLDASTDLGRVVSDKRYEITNVADKNNKNIYQTMKINNITIDTTKTKEGYILDARKQYVITSANIFNSKSKILDEDNVYCSLAKPLPYKKFGYENEGYLNVWFRSLSNTLDENLIILSTMADVWSERFSRITFKKLFSNLSIEYGGAENLKYVFKDTSMFLPKDTWFQISSKWKTVKNDKVSLVEFYLNGKKLDVEYFKGVKKLPLPSFFGLSDYKIFAIGLSIGYGEYDPGYPYFYGLFDNLMVSLKPIPDFKFKYDNKEASFIFELKPKEKIPLFMSCSIYNGTPGIYINDTPLFFVGGNLFTFPATLSSRDKSIIDIKFNKKEKEDGKTEIIDDIYIALVNVSVISTTVLFSQ
ncbi:MAG: hypothetical protein ACK4NF_00995, partial [Planctomycetota bacterium]